MGEACKDFSTAQPDYRKLYLGMFNRLTDGIEQLQSIQQEMEALYIEQTRPASIVFTPDFPASSKGRNDNR